MKVLINCERSAVVRDAFRARGHDAWSCDLVPSEGYDRWHLLGDAIECAYYPLSLSVLPGGKKWDLMIAHPDCTYITNSGVWALKREAPKNASPGVLYGPARWKALDEACAFFKELLDAPIPLIAVENPTPHKYAIARIGRTYDQAIQPYEFGDDASKRTCFWLKGLPPLVIDPALYVEPRIVDGKPRWANQTDSGQNRLTPSETRSAERARTYQGIANAMAEQWGGLL